ncbi:hypothetical protein ACFQ48_07925 [Hymenobacter caeli]|uniref:Uncharacterized protein n=1 Tax=Hymenobacter caeli TaxID=2735894 RepID=A0ABX2FP29_9BACT|nr:hypothetical protein [Hymenobacter caeli]NRT18170.1 hypothetical protein [Hymenobacter caeli]
MKKYLLLLAGGLWCSAAHAQAPVAQRVDNQRNRIAAGRADGQLTGRQARTLRAQDRGIRAQAHAERAANGGRLTGQEHRQINRELNQNSRQIQRKRAD